MSTPGQFGPSAGAPRKSGGTSILVIILIIFGVLFLACAGICGGCLWLGGRTISEAGSLAQLTLLQQDALSAINKDQPTIDRLGEGERIEITSLVKRDRSGELQGGGEDFQFDVRGSKGTATVRCTAVNERGAWKLTVITAQCSDGTTLNVPPPPASNDVQFDMPETPDVTK